MVAIKKLKDQNMSWDAAVKMPEIKALQKLNNHPNVIKIMEMSQKQKEIFIVFEYCDRNLY